MGEHVKFSKKYIFLNEYIFGITYQNIFSQNRATFAVGTTKQCNEPLQYSKLHWQGFLVNLKNHVDILLKIVNFQKCIFKLYFILIIVHCCYSMSISVKDMNIHKKE